MSTWVEHAPAKVNLTLHVTGRRSDGYHLLDSIVVFAEMGDIVTARPATSLRLEIHGPFATGLAGEADNLVLRAARIIGSQASRPPNAELRLEKNLPVASGIGGGSADAAATLRLLARMWDVRPPALSEVASLGADVPVCLWGRPVRMRGIGDVLDPLPPLPPIGLLLVNPGVPMATADVFRARDGDFSTALSLPAQWVDAASFASWLHRGTNDLEPAARRIRPEISLALDAIASTPGCLLARMSGSGATCFGLFADPASAARAAAQIVRPGWWCWGGGLASVPPPTEVG